MQPWDNYRLVKIEKGHLIDQIKNYTQDDWAKACERLSIEVRADCGRGHHIGVYKRDCPPERRDCCIATIGDMHQDIQRDIFKKVLAYGQESGLYDEDDIWIALGILKKKKKKGGE